MEGINTLMHANWLFKGIILIHSGQTSAAGKFLMKHKLC